MLVPIVLIYPICLSLCISVRPTFLTVLPRSAARACFLYFKPDGVQTRATRAGTLGTTSSTLRRGTVSALPARRTGSTWAWACAVTETRTQRSSGTALTSKSRPVSRHTARVYVPHRGSSSNVQVFSVRNLVSKKLYGRTATQSHPACWVKTNYRQGPRYSLMLHAHVVALSAWAQAVFESVVSIKRGNPVTTEFFCILVSFCCRDQNYCCTNT